MKIKLGLKLGSTNTQYTSEILNLFEKDIFQYIELFVPSGTYDETISYWKQFSIPFVIHAPHSAAGLNLANKLVRKENKTKIIEVLAFAEKLKSEYIIFHSGVNGKKEETIAQLSSFSDKRFLIENKPIEGLNGEKCVGCTPEELKSIIKPLGAGFCLDFGHAICAANSLDLQPFNFISELMELTPTLFHLTDGDFTSKIDMHHHYGKGNFPLKKLFEFLPDNAMVTNEAKRQSKNDLQEIITDCEYIKMI